ncbi:uncharacterized protein LOC131031602 [Cryptomeria japonica]|uniref:uncharacterized protein LOC131031602 n=1 Tax=Cryptomeria japonica TaxID=3369 RepID=UPI0025AD108E|nr:uncharacterized protein LOC131031602 [Cryptomeria japonica]
MGRRKLEVKYISDKAKRLKTLQIRKGGLFKKASQLSILGGCQVAVQIEFEGNVFKFAEDSTNLPYGGACSVLANKDNECASSVLASLSQQEAKDESLSSLEDANVFSKIPCWNDSFLEMERERDTNYGRSDGLVLASLSQAKDESLYSLEDGDVFSQIPCWNDSFLEMERESDKNYGHDVVGQMDSVLASLSQQEAKDESLNSLEDGDVFSQIPCWNDSFLEMERERDKNYGHDAVGQMDSLPEMIFPDISEELTSGGFL